MSETITMIEIPTISEKDLDKKIKRQERQIRRLKKQIEILKTLKKGSIRSAGNDQNQ